MNIVLAIAAGGAIGAVMRYAVYGASFSFLGHGFPVATMAVNIIGSFIIGTLIVLFEHHWQPSPELKLFLMTGVLGALTTFSNFSMDAVLLFEKGDIIHSAAYIFGSVFLSILALVSGMFLVRSFVL